MDKIYFNESIDFVLFLDTISNIEYFNKEIIELKRTTPFVFDDAYLLNYIKFINSYYKSFSYLDKNFLNTYFNKSNLFINYLIYLLFRKLDFNYINIKSFKHFLSFYYNCEIKNNINEKMLIEIIANNDKNLNSNIDVVKNANLILSIFEDNDILSNFVTEIKKIHNKFKKDLFEKDKDEIKQTLLNINKSIMDNKDSFYKKIKTLFKDESINSFKLIYSFYCPYVKNIYLSSKCIIFGEFSLSFNNKNDEKNYILLNKFLSQPKRYKIIKLLSKRKYYSNELAKELNLTAATMNYHINKLYELGLIIIDEGKQNRLYIDLNKNRLKFLLDEIQKDLLS